MIPLDAPRAAAETIRAYLITGYVFTYMRPHPKTGEPLARMVLDGAPWALRLIGLQWLVAWWLFRCPITSSIGAALVRHRFVIQPIIHIDAAGVAH